MSDREKSKDIIHNITCLKDKRTFHYSSKLEISQKVKILIKTNLSRCCCMLLHNNNLLPSINQLKNVKRTIHNNLTFIKMK